ncbi:MAG: hypothetical protein CMF17_06505 [Idiomarinaceae bacterium]|nr:hypothetical protein [Idiomarinaceae bacterium]
MPLRAPKAHATVGVDTTYVAHSARQPVPPRAPVCDSAATPYVAHSARQSVPLRAPKAHATVGVDTSYVAPLARQSISDDNKKLDDIRMIILLSLCYHPIFFEWEI